MIKRIAVLILATASVSAVASHSAAALVYEECPSAEAEGLPCIEGEKFYILIDAYEKGRIRYTSIGKQTWTYVDFQVRMLNKKTRRKKANQVMVMCDAAGHGRHVYQIMRVNGKDVSRPARKVDKGSLPEALAMAGCDSSWQYNYHGIRHVN